MTRESLLSVTDEEFDAFLDDVVELSLREACEARIWTMGATLNWIVADEGRSAAYTRALQIRAELAVHEGREIVDSATPDDVAVAKLRTGYRQWEASKWSRDRYGEKVDVRHGGAVGGLTIVLAQLPPEEMEKIISPERVLPVLEIEDALEAPEAVRMEAEAGEMVPSVSRTGVLPPESPPRLAVIENNQTI